MELIKSMMQQAGPLDVLLVCAGILLLIGAALARVWLARQSGQQRSIRARIREKRYLNMYRIFMNHPVFSRLMRPYVVRLTKKLSVLSVYTKTEIQAGAAKYAYHMLVGILAATALSCLVMKDLTSALLCSAFYYVYTQIRIERTMGATSLRVYRELKAAVASIRIEYKKSNADVLLAVENASYKNRIAPIMERLHAVLTAAEPQEALTEFYETVPFKQIQTLAMICYNIKNSGDALDKYNNSTFDEAMLIMNSDINQKIEQMDYEEMKFRRLENMALIGIPLTIALRYAMYYIMPSVALLYNSFAGFLIQNGVLFVSIYYYYEIAHAHLRSVMINDDRLDIVAALMERPGIRRLVAVISPQGAKRRVLKRKLELCFSKKSVEDFWCEKWLYALAAFAAVALIVFCSPGIERRFLLDYTKSFDMLADNSVYEDKDGNAVISKKEILEMDNTYIAIRNRGHWQDTQNEETRTEIAEFIRGYLPELNSMQMSDMISRLETKYQKLQGVGFHWYLLLIAYAVGFAAFLWPNRAIKKRMAVAKEEEEEEFLQLQVVTMILASMDLDTMEAVGHLALIADIHKDDLIRCDYGFASNPVEELELVQEKTQSENFKQFIGKLKETVEELSLKEAFADLASDREHICAERNAYIKEGIDRRRAKEGLAAMRPMNLAIYGMMVFPLLYTGISGMMSAMSQINRL